jgi:adenylate kinase
VGKSSLVSRLRRRDVRVLPIDDFLGTRGVVAGSDRRRGSKVVVTDVLSRVLAARVAAAEPPVLVEGHLAHHVAACQGAIVVRLNPRVLARRLRRRGWGPEKVRENVEAEGIDLILQECVARFGARRTYEVDSTGRRRHELARTVAQVAHGDAAALKNVQIGRVNWTDEILRWF